MYGVRYERLDKKKTLFEDSHARSCTSLVSLPFCFPLWLCLQYDASPSFPTSNRTEKPFEVEKVFFLSIRSCLSYLAPISLIPTISHSHRHMITIIS